MPILTFPLNCFVGLAVGNAEVTVAGYARQPMLLEYTDDGQTIANLYTAQWQYARQSWGTIDTAQLWNSATGGTQLASLLAAQPWVTIGQYDIARIPAGGLQCAYNVGRRPYGRLGYGTNGYGGDAPGLVGAGAVPTLFGTGLWGVGLYGTTTAGVLVERTFDAQDTCAPGTWAPFNPNALAA